ncbi:MAG: DUF2849 domain-containing protein [Woeseiaceae bacterium]
MSRMIIANALKDGRVVFLAGQGQWVYEIADGVVAHGEEDAEELKMIAARAEAENEVVGPELIEVTDVDGQLRPVKIREAIRAEGPTVKGHPDEGTEQTHVSLR